MNINSFDRSVKSWQFLGMIHVISFNSTGVGVHNSTCKCWKNELWSSLESCSQCFFNKNFMVSYGPFFSHLNILWMDTWMEPLTLTSTAQQSFLCYDSLHGWAAELSNWAGPNTIIRAIYTALLTSRHFGASCLATTHKHSRNIARKIPSRSAIFLKCREVSSEVSQCKW